MRCTLRRRPRQLPRTSRRSACALGERSPVSNLLFIVNDGGIASCLDAKTGDIIWSERLGGNFSASPILADGKLYAGNEEGKFYVYEAGREFKVLSENLFPDGFMASPAVSGKSLYLRSRTSLYRFDP